MPAVSFHSAASNLSQTAQGSAKARLGRAARAVTHPAVVPSTALVAALILVLTNPTRITGVDICGPLTSGIAVGERAAQGEACGDALKSLEVTGGLYSDTETLETDRLDRLEGDRGRAHLDPAIASALADRFFEASPRREEAVQLLTRGS